MRYLSLLLLIACGYVQKNTPTYKLVWSDEFEDPAIDTSKWKWEDGGHGWGNHELQYYGDRKENSYVKDGYLYITAIKEDYKDMEYTSARLNSTNLGKWKYGKIEVKATLPKGRGTWPAIWMLPYAWQSRVGKWPDDGEIDIMEHVGYDHGKIHGSIHTKKYNHRLETQKSGNVMIEDASENFHTYAIEWTPEYIKWLVDEKEYYKVVNDEKTTGAWPFDKEFHLLLNVAVGGDWGAVKGVDPDIWPQSMVVDYVRVYQKKP